MRTTKSTKLASLGIKQPLALAFTLVFATFAFSASPALAAAEPHPKIGEFGSFTNPNGIAVDEATGDVYVADIGTDAVYKFDANGTPVNFNFPAGSKEAPGNTLAGADTPAGSFSFPSVYGSPAAIAVDNACAQHSPVLTGRACEEFDPSAGDLYVMDAGHDAIDKFSPSGEYLSQLGGLPVITSIGIGFDPAGELLGLGVDGSGTVHVDLRSPGGGGSSSHLIDEFDGAAVNHLIARQEWRGNDINGATGLPSAAEPGDGFAVSATGDDYLMYEPSCSCTAKVGQKLSPLGNVDGNEAGDVAVAVDPATGHLYADDQSSVAEWDTGAMNQNSPEVKSAGTLVARFGSPEISGTSGHGGIAVDGKTGEIYVSNPGEGNPGEGKVYVFGSDAAAVTVGQPADVTREGASLSGTVDPRGVAVSECEFEYGLTDELGSGPYNHSVPCEQTPGEIGAGSSPVAVSAQLEGLAAGELYHFRLVATNANGAGEGSGMLPTLGVGFGIKSYEISFLNENGTPDTQAGSHPYKFVNSFTLNSHFKREESNADSPYIRLPDGVLRNLKIDLPPGFVGDPNAPSQHCTVQQVLGNNEGSERDGKISCPLESFVGGLSLRWSENQSRLHSLDKNLYAMTPVRGVALQLGTNFYVPSLFINNGVLAGGNYPVQVTVTEAPTSAPVIGSRATLYGVLEPCEFVGGGSGKYFEGCQEEDKQSGEFERGSEPGKAFLTMPTGCHGPLGSTIEAESWEEPGNWKKASTVTHNAAGTPVSLTGCSKLRFPAEISVKPDTTDASASSGLTVNVHVPQTAALNPNGLAESSLRDTTVTLPEGVAINPSGGDGLEACTSEPAALAAGALGSPGDQIGYKGQEELNEYEPGVKWNTFTSEVASPLAPGSNFCPNGSKVGTVKIKTPLLEHELEGAVYLAAQDNNPFGSLIAMYIVAEDPYSGSLIKLAGEVSLNPQTGQIVTTFKNTPDVPFENLELHFFGGERAPLATPSRCGTYTTQAVFTPWDGNGPVASESSFVIDHGPGGAPCPGATLPFNPSVNAGATNVQAGAFSPLTVTLNRKDGEQNLKSVEAKLPPGLSGVLTGVEQCPEPQANEGLCGENSKIGEATIGVGVGNQPFTVTGGKFYLTGPYNGSGACTVGQPGCAPFGITFEVPAKAGPFDLADTKSNHPACDCVVVRGKIELDPLTAAITITTDPPGSPDSIPTSIEGIPLEIQHVNATTTRGDFQFNPTSCAKMSLTATVQLSEGGSSTISTPFQVTNCAALKFEPKFSVSTSGKTSKVNGASLTAKVTYPNVPQGTDADLAKVKVELPKQLPSRLTTLQKACTDKQFEINPAACPSESKIGYATVHTPLIPVPLQGPVIFVSHGSEAFPSLTMVLQGYGITIDLVGSTFISKSGITSTTFKAVPDQPFSSFELTLPEGKYSALAANGTLCGKKLAMPTEFVAQNGAEIHQSTPITVEGCSTSLSFTHSIKKKTLKLSVYAPASGKITASGKGLTTVSKTSTGQEDLTLTLKQKKAGKLKTTVKVTFTPSTGKDRKKQAKSSAIQFRK
jgi:DNA-binding beta-propeller fold protein YncE